MSWVEELADLGREASGALVGVVKRLHKHDPVLANQLLASAKKLGRCLDDAQYAKRRERERMFDEASSAIAEAHTAIYLGESLGHLREVDGEGARRHLNRALAILGGRDAALLPPISDTN